jgi:hypothetical protein
MVMSEEQSKEEFINPIDDDHITETPNTLTYGHHRGSLPIIPTKEGDIKSKALSAMEHQTDIQLLQIKEQMALLAEQAQKIQKRVDISQQIYSAKVRFEPLINHVYHLYNNGDESLLVMVGPNDWGKKGCPYEFVASVRLLADHTWDVMDG